MYVFLIFGAVSLVTGILALWLLPDLPSTARFLTEREKAIALERVAVNRQGVKNHQFKWYQVRQAARDPKTWLLFIMAIGAQLPNSALTSVRYSLYCIFITNTDLEKTYYSSHQSLSAPLGLTHSAFSTFKSPAVQSNSSAF